MDKKRGQVTIFIVVGILICLIIIFFAISMNSSLKSKTPEIKQSIIDATPINSIVDGCISIVGTDAIFYTGLHGGYYNVPKNFSYNNDFTDVPFYFYEDRSYMPSREILQDQLGKYVDDNLKYCTSTKLGNLSQYSITEGVVLTSTLITSDGVIFNVEYPIAIKQGNNIDDIKDFYNTVKTVRLDEAYNTINEIIREQLTHPDLICTSCLVDIGETQEIYFDLERVGNSTVIFSLIDYNSSIDFDPYVFMYANKYKEYSCNNPPPDPDSSMYEQCMNDRLLDTGYLFTVKDIQDMNATMGQEFYYKINASGMSLTFEDYTPLFDISSTGEIKFTPTNIQLGNHEIVLFVKDDFDNQKYLIFNLNITGNDNE